jgi:hypothetical protein
MLPVNFHKTFIPERRLIASLLEYADSGKEGTYQEISADTGIPMGKSSGKVPAILDYATGMHLIVQEKKAGGIKKPVLTPFGETVLKEDPYLSEEMTQVIAHMNLCRSDIGALVWNEVFARGRTILGTKFTKSQLENYLVSTLGDGKERTGPLLGMYTDSASFERASVLDVEKESITRKKPPMTDAFALPYSAIILLLMEVFFPGENQVTVAEFGSKTQWFDICLWGQTDIETVLAFIERKGFVTIDRQMHPWIIERMATSGDVWPIIFDDLA